MKKIILAAIAAATMFATSANAFLFFNNGDVGRPSFNGFYAGVDGGFIRSDASSNDSLAGANSLSISLFDILNFPIVNRTIDGGSSSFDQNEDSAIGGLHLGWGRQFNQFYAGIEGFVNVADRNFETIDRLTNQTQTTTILIPLVTVFSTVASSNKLEMNPVEGGADLRLGVVTDTDTTLIYGKLGVAFNRLKLTSTNFSNYGFTILPTIIGANFNVPSFASVEQTKNVAGVRLGLGIEQFISCHWSIRADYTHTDYGTISQSVASANTIDLLPNLEVIDINLNTVGFSRYSTHVRSNAGTVGLSYYF